MEGCDCIEPQWPADELLVKYQYISDFFIALAYFSIPLELIYFVKKSSFFPYRWVLIQFGAFIVLCGATHLINLWTFTMHSRTLAIVMTVAKISTAIVSCATALMLVHIIPDLLSVKTRELFLKNKAEELDREMGLIRTQEETGRHVRMLTHEIRSTLDRQTILKTTLVELGRTLGLAECALWMPSNSGLNLQLSYTLHHQIPLESDVSINLPIVNQVFSSNHAIRIPHTCPLARIQLVTGRYVAPEVVAVRVPLLHLSNFQINDWPELSAKSYAIMVLTLPSNSARKWHVHELELVEVVADQVVINFYFPLFRMNYCWSCFLKNSSFFINDLFIINCCWCNFGKSDCTYTLITFNKINYLPFKCLYFDNVGTWSKIFYKNLKVSLGREVATKGLQMSVDYKG